jgi:hypothetical protein
MIAATAKSQSYSVRFDWSATGEISTQNLGWEKRKASRVTCYYAELFVVEELDRLELLGAQGHMSTCSARVKEVLSSFSLI